MSGLAAMATLALVGLARAAIVGPVGSDSYNVAAHFDLGNVTEIRISGRGPVEFGIVSPDFRLYEQYTETKTIWIQLR